MCNGYICILLVIILILIVINLYDNSRKKEYYQVSALSTAKKVEYVTKLIQKGIDAYNLIKTQLPQVIDAFNTLTNWSILKNKMCVWASNKKLVPALVQVSTKLLERPNLNATIISLLTSFKKNLLRLETVMSTASIISLVESELPSALQSFVSITQNIDKNIADILSQSHILSCP